MILGEKDWAASERPMRLAFALAVSLIGLGALLTRDEPAVDLSLVLPTLAVYWLWASYRRFPTWPVYLLGISMPIVLNIVESEDEVFMFCMILTVALLAVREPDRTLVTAVVLISSLLLVILGSSGALSDFAWPNWLVGTGLAWGAGEVVHRYALTVAELTETRALIADQAAVNERRRIARDVHDLVGHSLSVVMLHLTGARHLVRKDPEEAIRALEQAEAAGRASLAEIRRTVGLLREESDSNESALPSPDLADIYGLVHEFSQAGLNIELDTTGDLTQVDSATGLAGYRIAQEALTNVTRHSSGADVRVRVDVIGDACEVAVINTGGTPLSPGPRVTGSAPGFGLISMRERAKSVGGSLIAGPVPGGWSIEVSIPIGTARVFG